MDGESDSQLIRRMQLGDRDAAAVFYRRYVGTLWRFVCARLDPEADAPDIVAETFLAAIRGIASANADAPASCWLLGIARHKLADHHRRQHRHGNAMQDLGQRPDSPAPDMAATAESAEERARVLKALAGMEDQDRFVLEWKYLEGVSIDEISRRTSRTPRAVESMLYRARNTLRHLLAPHRDQHERTLP